MLTVEHQEVTELRDRKVSVHKKGSKREGEVRTDQGLPKGKLADSDFAKNWKPPTFTLKEIRDAVPAHCFKRNTFISLGHMSLDLAMVAGLFYLATKIDQLPLVWQIPAWFAYWICQGVVGTGLWVLAHECGHNAFSPHTIVNHSVGFVLHSMLLVPFFSWKYTHSKHHKGTNHMSKDQVFIPLVRSQFEKFHNLPRTRKIIPALQEGMQYLEDAPLKNFMAFGFVLLFGWPLYLLTNISSQKRKDQWVSHFFPNAPIFDKREYFGVVYSNVGIFIALAAMASSITQFGLQSYMKYYFIPYLFVNMWLVLITFLQHTDPKLPRYRGSEWDFMKGAIGTVDRDFGILNFFFHHITDTHVVHHLFSTMPFYHAQEATKAVIPILGEYYLYDNKPFWEAALECHAKCQFVEDSGDIVWFKH
ncbi:fatty acid desaturase-domain-containing protein [Globomyces pollinis-pini]|nr:fatty acid desaturase-domain-containing protein [Globomyces pollinis-pini]